MEDRQKYVGNNTGTGPVVGTDISALNTRIPVGTRPGYPSAPTRITTSKPLAVLGMPRIGEQLLKARELGRGLNGELAMTHRVSRYSYLGILSETPITSLHVDKATADKVFIQYNRDRYEKQKEAIFNIIKTFNESALRESQ